MNADWSIVVYATKLQCATRHVTLAILSRDQVAGVTSVLERFSGFKRQSVRSSDAQSTGNR